MLGYFKSFSSNIHSKYSVNPRSSFQVGFWEVYTAKSKATGEQVSVFVLERKAVTDFFYKSGLKSKSKTVSDVWEFATKGVQKLTKIRHPSVLKIVEPLEPHKNSLIFVSEKINSTLTHSKDLEELSILNGLSSIIQGLQFLHKQVGSVHCNLTPNSIFLDEQGDWKLAGFEFLVQFADYKLGEYFLPQIDPRMPAMMHPQYSYLAPELVMQNTVLPANDMWSLACVVYFIYTQKKPMNLGSNPSIYGDELPLFLQRVKTTQHKLPESLKPYLLSMFCENPDGRISLEVFENSEFIQNPLVKSLRGLEEYDAKPVEEKISFLNHFASLLSQFPKQIRIKKILKFAVQQLNGPREPSTGLHMSNVLFKVCVDMSKLSFQDKVLPLFAKLNDYTAFQDSVSHNLEVISRNTSDTDFSKHVLPVFVKILKQVDAAQYHEIQVRILNQHQVYKDNLNLPNVVQTFFPAVVDCFSATPDRGVKIACTSCLSMFIDIGLNRAVIVDKLAPALQGMKTRDPLVVEAVSNLWTKICGVLLPEQIFTLALPNMLDLSLSKQLTVLQFKGLLQQVRDQIDCVQTMRLKILQSNVVEDKDDIFRETPVASPLPETATVKEPINDDLFSAAKPIQSLPPVQPAVPVQPALQAQAQAQAPQKQALQTKPEPVFDLLDAPQPVKATPKPVQFTPLQPSKPAFGMTPLTPNWTSNPNPNSGQSFQTSSFMPLQPHKPNPGINNNDEFGNFVTSPSTSTSTPTSLI